MNDAKITSTGMRLIKMLVGQAPRPVDDLMEEAGVTRTAIADQLRDLMSAGYVERIIQPLPGRGRPRHLYAATPAAMVLLFANNQSLVVPAIWKAIKEIGGESLTREVRQLVCRSLVKHYSSKITASEPKKRIKQYTAILEKEGGLIDLVTRDGQLRFAKRSCPFISMFDEGGNVCAIDLELISAIAGCPVRLTACRHEGAPCCEFEIDTRSPKRSTAAHSNGSAGRHVAGKR